MEYCGVDLHQVHSQICIPDEAGGSLPWVSRLLSEFGHEVIVCGARRERKLKHDRVDAEVLARLLRMDPAKSVSGTFSRVDPTGCQGFSASGEPGNPFLAPNLAPNQHPIWYPS